MKKIALLIIFFSVTCLAAPHKKVLTVPEFIDKMVHVHHFDRKELETIFQKTAYLPEVIDRLNKPFEKKPWDFYRTFFLTKDRIQGGVKYWKRHQKTLQEAAKKYGVSPAVIVAIIGIETRYGSITGTYPELRALATLSFQYPKRAAFFQSELENYLLLARDYDLPLFELKGSYAGALGIPQFMPSNYRAYAVSYRHQKKINLLNNHDDAIFSIAAYLKRAGWEANQPVAIPAKINGHLSRWLISTNADPIYRIRTLKKFGITSPISEKPSRKAAFIALHDTHGEEYWITFRNFHAIMAYNPRTTYAMAIYQLSEAIKDAYNGQSNTQKRSATIAKR